MTMSSPYKFQINLLPSTGFNEIRLGSSLYDILNYLIKAGYRLKLAYSGKNMIDVPYIVSIKELSVRLVFNGSNQILQFIEFNKFELLSLTYQGNKIRHLGMKQIYNNSFGPTYPGEIITAFANSDEGDGGKETELQFYILSYPGISFKFLIPPEVEELNLKDKNLVFVKLLELDVPLSSILIHQFSNWDDVYEKQIALNEDAYILMDNKNITGPQSNSDNKDEIIIDRLDIDMPCGRVSVKFLKHPEYPLVREYIIGIHETDQQDVLAVLGPPDATFMKQDSRLNIHSSTHANGHSGDNGKSTSDQIFHNYFKFGFDILYDLSSHRGPKVKKIIIHNNLPNSLNFQKYKKCIWRMVGYKDEKVKVEKKGDELDEQEDEEEEEDDYEEESCNTVNSTTWDWINDKKQIATSEMYFHEIPKNFKTLNDPMTSINAPIILNRHDLLNSLDNSIEFITIDGESANEDSENGRNGGRAGKESKAWGQSLIYAYKRCIWEVVDNAVNSVTLY